MKTTIITVGSITAAQKAKKLLSSGGFDTRLIKLNTRKNGCGYGVRINDYSELRVAQILRDGNVSYAVYSEDDV